MYYTFLTFLIFPTTGLGLRKEFHNNWVKYPKNSHVYDLGGLLRGLFSNTPPPPPRSRCLVRALVPRTIEDFILIKAQSDR